MIVIKVSSLIDTIAIYLREAFFTVHFEGGGEGGGG